MPIATHTVNYFRPRRPGPEILLQDSLVAGFHSLLDSSKTWWVGGSLPLGASEPDLLAANYSIELNEARQIDNLEIELLAYLRAVREARIDTIASRLRMTLEDAESRVSKLSAIGALTRTSTVALTRHWRNVLPEVLTIEVKVSNWRRALVQASKNLVYSHYAYVAFPAPLATRVRYHSSFSRFGVGILAIADNGVVTVSRRPRRTNPRAWRYYYAIASHISTHGGENGVHRSH